jgi:hypothetical protein
MMAKVSSSFKSQTHDFFLTFICNALFGFLVHQSQLNRSQTLSRSIRQLLQLYERENARCQFAQAFHTHACEWYA